MHPEPGDLVVFNRKPNTVMGDLCFDYKLTGKVLQRVMDTYMVDFGVDASIAMRPEQISVVLSKRQIVNNVKILFIQQ